MTLQITLKYAGKNTYFWRKGKLELPMPFLMIKVSGNQRVIVTFNPERIPLHMQSTCGPCAYVLACATYLPSIS